MGFSFDLRNSSKSKRRYFYLGHTATLTGASLIIFGGHYYGGK